MPVNYLLLVPQIHQLADSAVQRQSELAAKRQVCQGLLKKYADNLISLQQKVEAAVSQNKGLRCAKPFTEVLTTHSAGTLPAPACTILAADGSQITPDPHGEVLYGLVNVGVLRMQPGSGRAPEVLTFSDLLFDQTLQTSSGLASEDLIALQRDVAERKILAELAGKETSPVIALTDGQLELYNEPRDEKSFKDFFNQYLAALDDLAIKGVITAGYVDRPRADLVVRLLELADGAAPADRPFRGVTDLSLFEILLSPGERSAVFALQSSSAPAFEGRKALHFFYLNVGSAGRPALARVEIPLWVAQERTSLDLLHSVLVEQACLAGSRPYPYPLIRAHEIAVVGMDERTQITVQIEAELLRRGLPPLLNSNKQSHKLHRGRGRM